MSSTKPSPQRAIITDGQNASEVLRILQTEIGSPEALQSVAERAAEILRRSVDPTGGPPASPSDGLLYGLIQSGKTSIMTVVAAMAADKRLQLYRYIDFGYRSFV
jgi:hypothetical protein